MSKKVQKPNYIKYDNISFYFRDYRLYLKSIHGDEYSQKNIAKKLKMPSAQYLSNIERDLCLPSVELSVRLAELYKIEKTTVYKLWMSFREKMYKKLIFQDKKMTRKKSKILAG